MKLNKKQKLRFENAEQVVNNFNEKFPVGSMVMWRSVGMKEYPHKEYEVRQPAFISTSGEPVTFLKGIGGYVSVLEDFVKY